MKDLFTSFTPQGKENIKLFPLATHHNTNVGGKRPLCIKYQCKGKCRAGCPQAHVRPNSMDPDMRSKVANAFRKAYS